MFCVIQEIKRKKPDLHGEYRDLEVYQESWSTSGKPAKYQYQYGGKRFERPHMEGYKISIHQSYRQNGKVKKRQFVITSVSYYDLVEFSFYDCHDPKRVQAVAEKLNTTEAALYALIDSKYEPLQDRIREEFRQTEEYKIKQQHRETIEKYHEARQAFATQYDCDDSEYERCFDVYGELKNADYLE